MEEAIKKYPLQWPLGERRTTTRIYGQFKESSAGGAQKFLIKELERLGARNIVVSSNVPIRQDGLMYADASRRTKSMEDPGVAVYFRLKDQQRVICCDQYDAVWKNVYAIGKGVEAMRGIERWGINNFLDRAFAGFQRLLPGTYKSPWEILGLAEFSSDENIEKVYKILARRYHPDNGGTHDQMRDLNWARDEAKRLNKER